MEAGARSHAVFAIGAISFGGSAGQARSAPFASSRALTRLRPGDPFQCYDQGEAAVIQSGVIAAELIMTSGGTLTLMHLGAGDLVPSLESIYTPAFSLHYRAEKPTHIAWVREDAIGRDVRDHASRAREALLFSSMRLITCLACLPATYRLYVELLRCATASNDDSFKLPTHGELASRACTTRETVSRELSSLRRSGVVTGDTRVRLLTPAALGRRIANALRLDALDDVWSSLGLQPREDWLHAASDRSPIVDGSV